MSQVPTTSRSESFSIDELANSVVSGKMRIPEFQRGFRWNSRDVIDLFDSIRRGYPIGSALLWRREAEAAEVRIGDIRVTASAKPDALWVVDGQQRLTTLVNAFEPIEVATPGWWMSLPPPGNDAPCRLGLGSI